MGDDCLPLLLQLAQSWVHLYKLLLKITLFNKWL